MAQFFSTVYGWITISAGVIATLWGLTKGLGALKKWIKQKYAKHKMNKQIPIETYKQVGQLVQSVKGIKSDLDAMKVQLSDNDEATASVMLQKMMWGYHHYVLKKNPIPLDVQTAMCVMYDEYKKNKYHNHVPQDFKQKLMSCELE